MAGGPECPMDPQGHNTRDDVTCEACGEPLALAAEPREPDLMERLQSPPEPREDPEP